MRDIAKINKDIESIKHKAFVKEEDKKNEYLHGEEDVKPYEEKKEGTTE
jgi:hypothetical protein